MTIKKMFDENPQKLIDDEVRFEFNEVAGKVVLIAGVAAGGAWFGFKFVAGPYTGREIYCEDARIKQGECYRYLVHCSDDGMLFNKNPNIALEDTQDEWGGEYYPEWDEMVFTIKEN